MQRFRVLTERTPKITNSNVDEAVYIAMVRKERPLWDKRNRDYKNLEVKAKIWKEIGQKCGTTDTNCKRRWTGLREKYRREKIHFSNQRRLGLEVDFSQRWRNYFNMQFLDQVYTPRGNYHKTYEYDCGSPDGDKNESDLVNGIKNEDDSSDECHTDEALRINPNTTSSPHDLETRTSPHPHDAYRASSSLHLPASLPNGNHPMYNETAPLNPSLIPENFPRIWVNSLPNLSIIPRHVKDDESSSQSLSQQSDANCHTASPNESVSTQAINKYASFGQYIADTLHSMEEKYANELHVHILQEIIKIKSKILKES